MPVITTEISLLSATQIAEPVRNHQLSPLEVVDAHLARIEKINSKINAFVQVDADRARQQGREAEARLLRNDPLGPSARCSNEHQELD
jgi:Asp-tRNA(Asn)/Glu-tRNA(Gln) amidotransferase A subunit family amidase